MRLFSLLFTRDGGLMERIRTTFFVLLFSFATQDGARRGQH